MEFNENVYQKEKLVIDLVKANLYGIIFSVPVLLLYGGIFVLIWGINLKDFDYHTLVSLGILFPLVLILGIVLHELIHGIVFARYAKNGFKSIKFGILWKMLTPYCHCKEPLQIKHYRFSLIMPTIVLGFVPFLVSLFLGSLFLLFFAIIMTIGGIGDFMIMHLLRNEKPNDWVQDHPSEAGCFIYRKKKY